MNEFIKLKKSEHFFVFFGEYDGEGKIIYQI